MFPRTRFQGRGSVADEITVKHYVRSGRVGRQIHCALRVCRRLRCCGLFICMIRKFRFDPNGNKLTIFFTNNDWDTSYTLQSDENRTVVILISLEQDTRRLSSIRVLNADVVEPGFVKQSKQCHRSYENG